MAELYGESPLTSRTHALDRDSAPQAVRLTEIAFTPQIGLRVDPKSSAAERISTAIGAMLPHQPDSAVHTGDLLVLALGPDEWLLVGREGTAGALQATLTAALGEDHGAVVDVSAQRTIIGVSGPMSRDLLNQGCALDLHPRAFGEGRCAQTLLARTGVVVVCRDAELPSFWLLVRSSFARYTADWLADAATEYRTTVPAAPGAAANDYAVCS
ncbi:sarcosine oxidase subunit gamma [Saccharopolyspora sp. HNM0983]|uniref:Sarcosine oxidase subunit gamma n=1 Tax=Saccharopolyspora montiporae TaxID=2781240 RepID=A0A929G257_9PSEU|nr:sarcosine oxidase subunit gamma family protein [Saccharopolyspora sp. HNM0983]MBE9375413.1 sarcosine oxidase subunit gamma [Saccharopolyspora sp. HNM0983]